MKTNNQNNNRSFGIQHWTNVLFCHWQVPKRLLKPLIFHPLKLDTFQQKAWLTVILFQAKYSRFKYMPKTFSYPPFWQMNIRTYVKDKKYGRGIYFLNIHCNDPLAVKLGSIVSLPYVFTPMQGAYKNNAFIFENVPQYNSQLKFDISYEPMNGKIDNDLADWLVERYRLFYFRNNYLMTTRISHAKWSLFPVVGEVKITGFLSEQLEKYITSPLLMGGKNKIAYLHPFEKIACLDKVF